MIETKDNKALIAALIKAKTSMRTPKFDSRVSTGTWKHDYASLSEVLACIYDSILKNDLFFTQIVVQENGESFLESIIAHSNGSTFSSKLMLDMRGKIQEVGSRLTYLKRYAAAAMFGLAAEEDNDAIEVDAGAKKSEVDKFVKLVGAETEIIEKILKHKKIKALSELGEAQLRFYHDSLVEKRKKSGDTK